MKRNSSHKNVRDMYKGINQGITTLRTFDKWWEWWHACKFL